MADVYCSPEKFGLEIVVSLSEPDRSYEFNMFVVWFRNSDKMLFYQTDSGCSCPSPFEDYSGVEGLLELKDMKVFEQELKAWGGSFLDAFEIQNVIDKVKVIKLYKCRMLDK